MTPNTQTIEYNDKIVRQFMLASIIWGFVGMSVGVLIASQLNFKFLNFNMEWLTFGRLRPLHTNAAIFAFVGNMMFAGVYHSTQRLVKARLASNFLSNLHFWGWQGIIVAAAVTLPFGFSRGKEYAELIWPINIAVAVIWVVFAINFFWTLGKRQEKSLYVAIWFYIATIVTVAMLYIVNHLSLPTSFTHSYPIFGGVQDALVQWWYGHNAVAFFLTTPILGIMYYYVPKAADRPVYSYRLSIVHFWSLVFIYIWAGPHHLLYTALPGWLQNLGMIFSLMLWAPSWGGMLNGLLTLRGAWHKLRTDPVLKFFAAGVTFYGMATFEGPLLSIKSVNALAHYTDWIVGHVHSGTLGWNGFMAAGMFYFLAPKLWKTKLYSVPLANMHFWLGTVGILLYVAAMWVSGITQGLMLNSLDASGALTYPNFLETVQSIRLPMLFRVFGGGLYLVGFGIMIYNLWKTIQSGQATNGSFEVETDDSSDDSVGLVGAIASPSFLYSAAVIVTSCVWMFVEGAVGLVGGLLFIATCVAAIIHFKKKSAALENWHESFLRSSMPFTALVLIAAAIGGVVQIVPLVTIDRESVTEGTIQKIYTPLELAGRDLYVSEGCYNCHSQMIRPFVSEVKRYGEYSTLGDSVYDHPYQWGSRRAGPDLARVGGKYGDDWHYTHMMDTNALSPGSNMPNYPWLAKKKTDFDALPSKIGALRSLGVPFPEATDQEIVDAAKAQAQQIASGLAERQIAVEADRQIIALIAYLQQLGKTESADNESLAATTQ